MPSSTLFKIVQRWIIVQVDNFEQLLNHFEPLRTAMNHITHERLLSCYETLYNEIHENHNAEH